MVEFCGNGQKTERELLRLHLAERYLYDNRHRPLRQKRRIAEEVSEALCPTRAAFRVGAMTAAAGAYRATLQGLEAWHLEQVAPFSARLIQSA